MVDPARRTVEAKNSTPPDSHEERETERKRKSRGKTSPRARPSGSKRGNSGVENRESTVDSTVLSEPQPQATDAEIETPGKLTPRQIAAIQNDYRNGLTVKQIELATGVRAVTIYKYVRHIEPPTPPPEENDNSDATNVNATNATAAVPPAWTVSQPIVAAQPPRVVDLSPSTEEKQPSSSEPNEDGYESTHFKPQSRLPLPIVDQQSITELILLFGSDMRRRGYTNFLSYFEEFVIPRFEELEFWEGHVPGNSSQEKRHNLTRYLWIATKYFALQKEYADYEAANNGVKPES